MNDSFLVSIPWLKSHRPPQFHVYLEFTRAHLEMSPGTLFESHWFININMLHFCAKFRLSCSLIKYNKTQKFKESVPSFEKISAFNSFIPFITN